MTITSAADKGSARAARGALALAASPTFAMMAYFSANRAPGIALCASDASHMPDGGMTAMYLLMSFFHLPTWLELASRLPQQRD